MRLPSIKRLEEGLNICRDQAKQVRRILECRNVEAVCALSERAASHARDCFGRSPLQYVKLLACDAILETHGVEFIAKGHNKRSPSIEYCNTGDTYAATLMWMNGRYSVGCWGDVVERGHYD